MIPRLSLFSRYLVISIFIIFIFASSLGFLSVLMIRQFHKETPPMSPSAVIFAKFLHRFPKDIRENILKEIDDQEPNSRFQLWLVTREGQILFPRGEKTLPVDWEVLHLPNKIFEYTTVTKTLGSQPLFAVVQIDEDPSQFLIVKFLARANGTNMVFINTLSLFVAVILGTTLSLFILFYSLKKKARLADSVISELQKGNLKARFPITIMDEAGEAMLRFNKMADEIERLVERLKTTEKSRMALLQELAHDLRTPVSSLKSMLETLSSQSDRTLPEEIKKELMMLSLKEVDYFEHLVEDLLFLAQASEPKYKHVTETVNLNELLKSEIESSEKTSSPRGRKIKIVQDFNETQKEIKGDAHLLQRLFRNALDNAVFSAQNQVVVHLYNNDENSIECVIEDDGSGFSPEAFKEFGHRKMSRKFASPSQKRASIGLGSVIMNAVVQLHGGELRVTNLTDFEAKICGAQVKITLPI